MLGVIDSLGGLAISYQKTIIVSFRLLKIYEYVKKMLKCLFTNNHESKVITKKKMLTHILKEYYPTNILEN